jgi:hypothetical protein
MLDAGRALVLSIVALRKENSEVGKASAAGHNLPNQTWIGPMTKTLGILTAVSLMCMHMLRARPSKTALVMDMSAPVRLA